VQATVAFGQDEAEEKAALHMPVVHASWHQVALCDLTSDFWKIDYGSVISRFTRDSPTRMRVLTIWVDVTPQLLGVALDVLFEGFAVARNTQRISPSLHSSIDAVQKNMNAWQT